MQLIWWLLLVMGHMNILMDESKPKIHQINMMKLYHSCENDQNSWNLVLLLQILPNLVVNDYKLHVVANGVVAFWLILLMMVDRCLNLYIRLLFATTPTTMATFDLWMNKGQHDTFVIVINVLSFKWKPWHVTLGLLEANDSTG